MRQTTRNLIGAAAVAACMAIPLSAGSLAAGISKAFGHPLLDEGRDAKPKVVAQLSVQPEPKSKTPSERSGGRIINLDGGIVPETQIETPKQTSQEHSWKNILLVVGLGICGGILVPVSCFLGEICRKKTRR